MNYTFSVTYYTLYVIRVKIIKKNSENLFGCGFFWKIIQNYTKITNLFLCPKTLLNDNVGDEGASI